MKKIVIMALVLIGSVCYSAEAQQREACKGPDGKVCKRVGKSGVACYKTPYAHNFKVCKGASGYYICCEEPNQTNSTFHGIALAKQVEYTSSEYTSSNEWLGYYTPAERAKAAADEMAVPQSQSYAKYSSNAPIPYDGGYNAKQRRIKTCNNTNNVAEANRQAYSGCPTAAYDGPDRNRERNVNVSSPSSSFPVPPSAGTGSKY